MSERWWEDDEDLLSVVLDAIREERAVPTRVVDAGKASFTWQSVDDELAALTYDSSATVDIGSRSERAGVREVTFAATSLTIHVQVTGRGLHGQIVPAQPARLEVQIRTRPDQQIEIDEHGWFSVSPVPSPPFRLLIRLASDRTVHTDWLQA